MKEIFKIDAGKQTILLKENNGQNVPINVLNLTNVPNNKIYVSRNAICPIIIGSCYLDKQEHFVANIDNKRYLISSEEFNNLFKQLIL